MITALASQPPFSSYIASKAKSVGGKGVRGRDGRGWTASVTQANTQPTTEPHLSRFSLATTFLSYLYPPLVVAGNRALSEAPTYSPDIRAQRSFRMPRETFRLRVPTTFAVSIRPAGITGGGRHIGSDATTIFDSFVPAMNFRVVASSMLPRSIAGLGNGAWYVTLLFPARFDSVRGSG